MSSISASGSVGSLGAMQALSSQKATGGGAVVSDTQIAAAMGDQIQAGVMQEAAIRTLAISQDAAADTVSQLLGSLLDTFA